MGSRTHQEGRKRDIYRQAKRRQIKKYSKIEGACDG